MRAVKTYIMLSVVLMIYVSAISLLLRQFYTYQKAYYSLSMLITHSSIEVSEEEVFLQEQAVQERN